MYNTTNWLEKNRDTQPAEILEILKNSKNHLIRTIFNGEKQVLESISFSSFLAQLTGAVEYTDCFSAER